MAEHRLVLLTSQFPFGTEVEPFLEAELPVLSERFDRVFVLPSSRVAGVRATPPNVDLVEMAWLSPPISRNTKRALGTTAALDVVTRTICAHRDLTGYARSTKSYADILGQQVNKARELRAFVERYQLKDAIFYDYWFENSTLALALCRRSRVVATAVARAHRFDVFDEAWNGGPVPFRDAKATYLDAICPVSDAGARYMAAKLPRFRGKLFVHRLGAVDPGLVSPVPSPSEPPLVVTCSRLVGVKRIDLVPSVLTALGRPVRWVHLGDGPERSRVELEAERLLPPGSWRLLGRLDNREVLSFYRDNAVQALLSVSSSEGIPVSMMEAQSFGVPIVACAVGGVSEVVTRGSGYLVPRGASPDVIAAALTACINDASLSRSAVQAEFRKRYDARINYGRFADFLLRVHAAQGTCN